MTLVRVALPVPMRRLFDYRHADGSLPAGVRVRVPFGSREMVGVVMDTSDRTDISEDKLKTIQAVLDTEPVMSSILLSLCRWLSQYYQHPIGEVCQVSLPVALRKGGSADPDPVALLKITTAGRARLEQGPGRAKKQYTLLQRLHASKLPRSQIRTEFSAAIVRAALENGWIEEVFEAQQPLDWRTQLKIEESPRPNVEQALAITGIRQLSGEFAPALLEGVTGSGKTEVYLQTIEGVLEQGKQVLILVPEIGLTPQTVSRFEKRFGIAVGVLHSNLTDNERLSVWQKSRAGELGIVIGTRSAIFTPLKAPGMLIVDEEHDSSYKQQDGLRYNARDLAVVRARLENIPLVLGSATPSLETLQNALTNKYRHFTLHQRAGVAVHTAQQLVDIRHQPLRSGLSPWIISRLREHLSNGNQVMLFINRRGYAPALLCHDCGYIEMCQRCEKPFTLHKQLNKLQCHHCGSARPIPPQCRDCGSKDVQPQGLGTEQLESELGELFPQHSCVRVDSDSMRGKSRLQTLLDEVNRNQHQILIGTQILSKGHDFPNVTMVVILEADGALFSADFRASEHLAQLITQLSGRAGRADKPGEMWLQTHHPDHPLLLDLIHNGYGHFARHALLERQQANLPPFTYQALFRAEAHNPRDAHQFLQEVAHIFTGSEDIALVGPIPALMEKRQGRFRLQLLLQSGQRARLQAGLHLCVTAVEALPGARKVRWSLDVDPQDFI